MRNSPDVEVGRIMSGDHGRYGKSKVSRDIMKSPGICDHHLSFFFNKHFKSFLKVKFVGHS